MNNKKKFKESLLAYISIIVGSIITALAINIFLVPYKIAPGGVSGIATVIYYVTGGRFPVGMTMLALNVPLFIVGFRFIGRKFFIRTLFATIFLSFIIDLSEPFTDSFAEKYLSRLESVNSTPDLLLYALFGGLFMGLGLGMVFKFGATTGGTDLASSILIHFIRHFTMGKVLLFFDTSVIILASIVFKSFQLGLYAIISLFVMSKVIDAVLEGINFAKSAFIISDKSDEIADRILKEMERGVTALKGTGMYTGNEKQVLLCVLHRAQIPTLKEIVKEVDERAFIILTDIREVLGEGFRTYD